MEYEPQRQKTGGKATPNNALAVSQRGPDRRDEIWSYGLTCWVTAVYLAGR
jgi:hypothetical protein